MVLVVEGVEDGEVILAVVSAVDGIVGAIVLEDVVDTVAFVVLDVSWVGLVVTTSTETGY